MIMIPKITVPTIAVSQGIKNCLPFFGFFLLLFWWSKNNPFFWDTVLLSSKMAHFYYDHQFQQLLLPLEIDAGHPPFFGIYLAFWWMLLGKNLLVSHLAMLPFILGIVWQVYRLCHFALHETSFLFLGMSIVLSDPTLWGQCSMVSPDVVLTFACLWAINSLIHAQNLHLVLATLILGMTSIRGLFAFPALYILSLIFAYAKQSEFQWRWIIEKALWLMPVALIMFSYYAYHFIELGWWISTPNEGWSEHRQLSSFSGMVRNVGILGWRFLDFGRLGLWLLLGALSWRLWINLKNKDARTILLGLLPLTLLFFQAPSLILIQNPIGHRYLMPVFLTFALWVVYLLASSSWSQKMIRWIGVSLLLLLWSGHLWVYPAKIAQGWDSSLAHVPYFELRQKMIDYLAEAKIPLETVGTEFPNNVPLYLVDLNNEKSEFAYKDLINQQYIFYANVFNDFSDAELEELKTNWVKEKEFSKMQIQVILYRKERGLIN